MHEKEDQERSGGESGMTRARDSPVYASGRSRRGFDADRLYNDILRYYIDKKGYRKRDANRIAQIVLGREIQKRTCKNSGCRHRLESHMRGSGFCMSGECSCTAFAA